ncbi:TatD family hydrolase [Ursidibacter maritimus]|uniref:TatD family hydrolase n=1 Tax=Ursidibacter maritimus TaxID=1331689 RepID=A0A949T383_9PAST|nr:TatD family hydrolase [Ursidibacter maritimus]KAE9540438.1 deoxyribonuclease [Ursidibacter maritimus]MBV6524539.1 TatD family hydrolase [Ursidibacter maritimus]MBV6525027.1 TatD family hydrolase [Ursidibacter maritimus]MBV6527229.1 TatD family hydrolase [Ursidibacter maritimus]MBV6530193.1 TatD family hydrolase [Ursidibacter maritimus]
MKFFDTHTHLDYLAQDLNLSVSQLVENAKKAQVERILVVAVFVKNFAEVTACSRADPQHIVYGLGLHPLYIEQHQQNDLDLLEQHLQTQDPNCTAIAEIGLERAVAEVGTPELWQKQCEFLDAQLQLAKRYDLPVNLHSRKSHEQLYTFLKQAKLNKTGVVHGFSGSYEQAKRFVDLGYKIGVGGTITYQRANKTRDTIAKLPLDALLLETDSPDMPVFGFQGQPNRPDRLRVTFESLCSLRQEEPELIAETIWQNSERLFGLGSR